LCQQLSAYPRARKSRIRIRGGVLRDEAMSAASWEVERVSRGAELAGGDHWAPTPMSRPGGAPHTVSVQAKSCTSLHSHSAPAGLARALYRYETPCVSRPSTRLVSVKVVDTTSAREALPASTDHVRPFVPSSGEEDRCLFGDRFRGVSCRGYIERSHRLGLAWLREAGPSGRVSSAEPRGLVR